MVGVVFGIFGVFRPPFWTHFGVCFGTRFGSKPRVKWFWKRSKKGSKKGQITEFSSIKCFRPLLGVGFGTRFGSKPRVKRSKSALEKWPINGSLWEPPFRPFLGSFWGVVWNPFWLKTSDKVVLEEVQNWPKKGSFLTSSKLDIGESQCIHRGVTISTSVGLIIFAKNDLNLEKPKNRMWPKNRIPKVKTEKWNHVMSLLDHSRSTTPPLVLYRPM